MPRLLGLRSSTPLMTAPRGCVAQAHGRQPAMQKRAWLFQPHRSKLMHCNELAETRRLLINVLQPALL